MAEEEREDMAAMATEGTDNVNFPDEFSDKLSERKISVDGDKEEMDNFPDEAKRNSLLSKLCLVNTLKDSLKTEEKMELVKKDNVLLSAPSCNLDVDRNSVSPSTLSVDITMKSSDPPVTSKSGDNDLVGFSGNSDSQPYIDSAQGCVAKNDEQNENEPNKKLITNTYTKSLNRKQAFPKRKLISEPAFNDIAVERPKKLNKRKNTPVRVATETSITDESSDDEFMLNMEMKPETPPVHVAVYGLPETQTENSPGALKDDVNHLDDMLPKFQCETCGQNFIRSDIRDIHAKYHLKKVRKQFDCNVCGKVFRRQKYLNKHMLLHVKTKALPHVCDLCGKSFSSTWKIKRHERTHAVPTHQCVICMRLFRDQAALLRHLVTHDELHTFICHICGQVYLEKEKFDEHMERGIHQDSAMAFTNSAKEETNSDSDATIVDDSTSVKESLEKTNHDSVNESKNLSKNNAENNNVGSISVSENSLDANTTSNLSVAKQSIVDKVLQWTQLANDVSSKPTDNSNESDGENGSDKNDDFETDSTKTPTKLSGFPRVQLKGAEKFEMDIDEMDEESEENLSESDDETMLRWMQRGNFVCFYCSEHFTEFREFQSHVHKHVMTKPFVCTLCGKCLTSSTSLKRHMLTHKNEKPWTCDICGRGFVHNCDLQDHRRTHTGERPYVCFECGKDFATRNNFNGHRKLHSKVLKHFCPHCSKGFICKRALKRHLFSHTEERPFKCEICSNTFKDINSLRRHTKRHDNIMTHICEYCDRGFNHSTDWRRHVRTHTNERPFKCEICGKGFKQNHHLTDHMRTHTGEKPFGCPYCDLKCATKAALNKHKKRHKPGGPLYDPSVCIEETPEVV